MRKLFGKKKFDIEACIAGSLEGLQLMNQSHSENWRLGQEQSWKVDEQTGQIVFGFTDGTQVVAPVQVIGTFHPEPQLFMWAWNHSAVPRRLCQHAAKVKAFGQTNQCKELTQKQMHCPEKRAWEYTALAMLLAEANGAYRAQIAPDAYAFLTFGEVMITTALFE